MRVEETCQAVKHLLPNDYVVVLRPDLPNLLRGPDLMIGGAGRLFAIFRLQSAEQRTPDRLLARLALSRLALPQHTVCVLLWDSQGADRDTMTVLTSHFHATIPDDSPGVLSDQVLESSVDGRAQAVPLELQGRQYHRAAALMTLSETWLREAFPAWLTPEPISAPERTAPYDGVALQVRDLPRELFDAIDPSALEGYEPVVARSWFRGTRTIFPTLLERDDAIVTAASGPSLSARLARCGERLLLRTTALDNGVPYPQATTLNVLLVDEVPRSRFDPLKAIRATCFAGWSLIGPPQLARLDQTLQELRALPTGGHA